MDSDFFCKADCYCTRQVVNIFAKHAFNRIIVSGSKKHKQQKTSHILCGAV